MVTCERASQEFAYSCKATNSFAGRMFVMQSSLFTFPNEAVSKALKAEDFPLFPVLCYVQVCKIAGERVRGSPDAVRKHSSYYLVLFQTEDIAEQVASSVSCSHHDVQSLFASPVCDRPACNY